MRIKYEAFAKFNGETSHLLGFAYTPAGLVKLLKKHATIGDGWGVRIVASATPEPWAGFEGGHRLYLAEPGWLLEVNNLGSKKGLFSFPLETPSE